MLGYDGYDFDFSDIQGRAVVGVLSDTHGRLSSEAFKALANLDPDLIVHAGDICGDDILPRLEMLAPVVAVLGNNDYPGRYGSQVRSRASFELLGIDFNVVHIWNPDAAPSSRVQVCGHTHVPLIEHVGASLVVNPGSVTRPRGLEGATIACIDVEPGYVRSVRIIPIE